MRKKQIISIMLLLLFLLASGSASAISWTSLDFGCTATVTDDPLPPSVNWTALDFGCIAEVDEYSWGNWSDWWNFTYADTGSTPTQTNPSPVNNSVEQVLTPGLGITVNDADVLDALNVTWSSNSSGPWLTFGTNNSVDVSGGAERIYQTNSNFSVRNTTYYWNVSVTDGTYTNTKTYNFDTLISDVEPPYNGSSYYDTNNFKVNLTWVRGNRSTQEVVIQNNNSYPSSPTDGWVRQNSTNTYVNLSITYKTYFTVWSYNASTGLYSIIGLHIPWGALGMQCYDETNNTGLIFDVLITNEDLDTLSLQDLTNIHYLDLYDIPYGDNTIFYVSSEDYESRTYYYDLEVNNFYNLTFYLPYAMPSGGTTDPDYDPENESYSTLYLLTVVDEADIGVKGVKIRIMRYINETGTYENVTILMSDANGQADVYLFAGTGYKVNLSKEGYVSRTDDWKPSDSIFTKTFKILWQNIPVEPDTFGDIISFYGTLYVNNTMKVTFYDLDNATTDSHFLIYEDYNDTLTYMGEYTGTTSNDIVFWITVSNATRLHIIVLYMNHSTLGIVSDYRIVVYPVHISPDDDRVSGNWLENLIRSVVGDFDYGYVITFIWYFPCVILIGGLAALKHPGIGILAAGFYSIWITWYLFIPEEAKILTFAGISLAIGSITLFLVKGKKVIQQ